MISDKSEVKSQKLEVTGRWPSQDRLPLLTSGFSLRT
jgi:hypothetical protein